jgi:threonine aldolase
MPGIVDLRSDTVTRPSAAMRDVIARAAVGDDVFGEDPSVNELEQLAAAMMDKPAALFVPSGCMANLLAQMVHVRRGDEVVVGQDCHIVRHEVGSGAAIAGVQYEVVPGDGCITAKEVEERIKAPTFHTPGTGLVWVENTHNMAGGKTTSLEELRRIAAVCRARGIPVHLDGARIFNAAAALGVSSAELAACADSASFCLSKGLGAPVGSLVCGDERFRSAAHRLRKMLGGGMRQAGILAAAGRWALENNVARLGEDHANARRLAEGLAGAPGLQVDARPETNIVMAEVLAGSAEALAERAARAGVFFLALGPRKVRFVTHLDVDAAGIARAISVVRQVLGA